LSLQARVRRWTPSTPKAPTPLLLDAVPGAALDDATIEAMWRLRVDTFPLKPEVDPAVDRARYARRVRMGQRTMLLRDPDGGVQGTFSFFWTPSPDGQQLWLFPEYGYLGRAYRGHPALAWGVARGLLAALRAARRRPLWFAGIGYPRSHQSLARVFRPLHTLADPDLPDDARAVLVALHERFAGASWDRHTHRVWLPTLPREQRPAEPGPAWQRFETICPDWADGYGVGLAARIDPRVIWRAVAEGRTRSSRA